MSGGQYPIVRVEQPVGPPKRAEVRERRPSSNPDRPELVKVVYVDSRTAAWISSARIIRDSRAETRIVVRLTVQGRLGSIRAANKLVDSLINQDDDRLLEYEVTSMNDDTAPPARPEP